MKKYQKKLNFPQIFEKLCLQSLHKGDRIISVRVKNTEEVLAMAKYCEVCGKGVVSGNNVSHSHRISKRKWAPNVQRVRVVENGAPVRKYVCTRCLRSGKVERFV